MSLAKLIFNEAELEHKINEAKNNNKNSYF